MTGFDDKLRAELARAEQGAGEEALAGLDAELLIEGLAGPGLELDDDELDDMFVAASRDAPARRERTRPVWIYAAAAALVVGLVVALVLLATSGGDDPLNTGWDGVKGVGPAAANPELEVLVGRRDDGKPTVDRSLVAGEPVRRGEPLLFRFRLDRRAFVKLALEEGGRVKTLWTSDGAIEIGEHEVGADGMALALPTEDLKGRVKLVLVTQPEPLLRGETTTLENLRSCRTCELAVVPLEVTE